MITFSINPSTERVMDPKFCSLKAHSDYDRVGESEAYWKSINGSENYGEQESLEALGRTIQENERKVKLKREVNLLSEREDELGYKGVLLTDVKDEVSAYDHTNELIDLSDLNSEFNFMRDILIIEAGFDLPRLLLKAWEGHKTAIQKLKLLIEEQNIADLILDIINNPYGKAIIKRSIVAGYDELPVPSPQKASSKAHCA